VLPLSLSWLWPELSLLTVCRGRCSAAIWQIPSSLASSASIVVPFCVLATSTVFGFVLSVSRKSHDTGCSICKKSFPLNLHWSANFYFSFLIQFKCLFFQGWLLYTYTVACVIIPNTFCITYFIIILTNTTSPSRPQAPLWQWPCLVHLKRRDYEIFCLINKYNKTLILKSQWGYSHIWDFDYRSKTKDSTKRFYKVIIVTLKGQNRLEMRNW
jgi:hypothetical protein